MMNAVKLFVGQFTAILLVALNIRALAKGFMWETAVTEFLYAAVQFGLIRWVGLSPEQNWWAYAAGATCGVMVAIRISRRWDT